MIASYRRNPMSQRNMSLSMCILIALCGATTSAHAADPACKPVFEALTKAAATPNHQFMTETAANKPTPESSEVIATANMMYTKIDTTWHGRPFNPQQQATQMREAYKTAALTCRHLRDETLAGDPVAVYDTQDKQEGGSIVNSQIWVSKARGLPVKQTIDMDVGGGSGKSHTEVRVDYANVQPPAGVN
ncbi:MAG: hypothetical protein ABI379_07515 [Rhodanobacter sp.]